MNRTVGQVIFFILAAAVLGAGRNVVVPGGIDWVGQWSGIDPAAGDSVEVPSSASPDDPPFLTFAQAAEKHADPNTIFIDARYPEDYETGSIPGAVLLPFEMFDDYWPGVEPVLPKDRPIVTYCSGSECELSLFLARLLVDMGYEKVSIFFGGARLWEENGMPVDTLTAPPPGATPAGVEETP